jgi:WD40 repeat protein
MHLVLTGSCDTGLTSLHRVACGQPPALFVSSYLGGEVWQLDWQRQHYVRQYKPKSLYAGSPVRQACSAQGMDVLERPLHDVRAIIVAGDPLVIDSDRASRQTHLINLRSGQTWHIARTAATTATCTQPITMIALGSGARIRLLQWPQGSALGELAGHNEGCRDMAFSPDNRWLVSVGGESEDEQHRDAIRLWDVQTHTARRGWVWHHLGAVAFHPGGELVAVGCMMPSAIKLWRLADDCIETVDVDVPAGVSALCFSPDGRWLWVGGRAGRVLLFTVQV